MKRLNLALAVGSLLFLAACGSDTTAKDTTDNGGTTGGETGGTTGGETGGTTGGTTGGSTGGTCDIEGFEVGAALAQRQGAQFSVVYGLAQRASHTTSCRSKSTAATSVDQPDQVLTSLTAATTQTVVFVLSVAPTALSPVAAKKLLRPRRCGRNRYFLS